jgi:hypothetical protein
MAKTIVERQMKFKAKRKAEGGMRLDMWVPPSDVGMLKQLLVWRGWESVPQAILDIIHEAWRREMVEAARQHGNAEAQFEYAWLYAQKFASREGTRRDAYQADKWFLESAKQGYRESAAYNNLGILELLCRNENSATDWIQKSAAKGNKVALYNLGLLGLAGRGVQASYPQVAKWFLKSAEQGFSQAQEIAGVLYAIGKGETQNHEKAFEWLCRGRGEDTLACENYLAWLLSTFPHDAYCLRDGKVAVTIAERLIQSSESTEHLGTLAAAYAEAERFEEAIKTQQKVRVKLHSGRPSKERNVVVTDCERRLTSYIAKKPWRDASLRFSYCWDFGDDKVWALPTFTYP